MTNEQLRTWQGLAEKSSNEAIDLASMAQKTTDQAAMREFIIIDALFKIVALTCEIVLRMEK